MSNISSLSADDQQSKAILQYFGRQLVPPGRRMAHAPTEPSVDKFAQYDRASRFQYVEQALGRKHKRAIDKNRTAQNYYLSKEVHQSTLDHYENMDWWERDTTYDFYAYIDNADR